MITDLIFVSLYIAVPAFSLWILNKTPYRISCLTITSFTIISFIVLGYLGYLLLYFKLLEFRVSSGITNQQTILKCWFASSFTLLSLILGIVLSCVILPNGPLIVQRKYLKRLSNVETLILILIFIISVLVMIIYLSKLPKIALISLILGVDTNLSSIRSDMGNNFSGKYHWYSLFMHDFLNLITFCFFANWMITKKRFYIFLFIMSLFFASFSAFMALEKAPIVWLIIGLIMVYIIVCKNCRISYRNTILFTVLLILFLACIFKVVVASRDISTALYQVFSRTLAGGTGASYYYIDFFPAYHDYLLGRSFPNPGGILPFEHFQLTVEIMKWRFPSESSAGVVGSSPSVFWAELYANFSWFGVVVLPVFVGFSLTLLDKFISKLGSGIFIVGLKIWMILHYKNLSSTGLSEFFPLDMPAIVIILFAIIFTLLCNRIYRVF